MPMSAHRIKFVPTRRYTKRTTRDHRRDDVMKMVYSRPGFGMRIAEHLGLSYQVVSAWKRVPAHHVMTLAPMLELSPEQIRPDVFGTNKKRRKANADNVDQ